ncbi:MULTISPECIES: hypothetical protein [unclassified Exiguobacterium]|uniref:hypothetical protein n=1 Tax=unclassified Exiguobacterium TaxID=2644629 RepID=UPI0003FAD0D9|nr:MULTISPECIES: hypothetical protein [unclassified Exiguobacterium]MCQ4090679.1 hypothetical protein [Exiguobacterium sp. LL15]
MLKNLSARQWLIMTVLFVCITYGWIVIGDAWINPTLLFGGALIFTSGAVLSFSLALARTVRLTGIGLTMMLVSIVTTLVVSASVLYGVYQIVA